MLFAMEQKAQPPQTPEPATPADDTTTEPPVPDSTNNPAETAEVPSESFESEPVTEGEEIPEPETDKDKEDVPSQKTSSDKEARIREKVQKRVSEEVAKRKVLEERLANVEAALKQAEIQKANPPQPMPKGSLPLSDYNDPASLEKYESQAKQAKRWATDQLAREDLGEGVQLGDQLLNREQIRDVLRKAEIALEDQIPARKQFLAAKYQASQQAVEIFPFLKDPHSEDYQIAVQAYRLNPWLQDLPNADFIVGVQVEGLKALKARQEAMTRQSKDKEASTPKPKPKTLPAVKLPGDQTAVSSGTSTPRIPTASAARNALDAQREKLRMKGAVTASEAAALLQRSEQLRTNR